MRPLRLLIVVATLALAIPRAAHAGHVLEAGTGFQNTGASRDIRWLPAIQGSRKDLPVFVGWRWLGERRLYWAPYARLDYVKFWSLGGAGNLLGVTLAPAGLGVYLSRPPASLAPEQRRRRWFATLEINFAALQLGGNATPGSPTASAIPDADAYRARLRDEYQRTGGISAASAITQFYPFGEYAYVSISVPIQLRVWNQVTRRAGVGLFFELTPAIFEWQLGGQASSTLSATPAYGFSATGGATVVVF